MCLKTESLLQACSSSPPKYYDDANLLNYINCQNQKIKVLLGGEWRERKYGKVILFF